MQGRQRGRGRRRVDVQFIITDPSATANRPEVLGTIRSHARRWTWQQSRNNHDRDSVEGVETRDRRVQLDDNGAPKSREAIIEDEDLVVATVSDCLIQERGTAIPKQTSVAPSSSLEPVEQDTEGRKESSNATSLCLVIDPLDEMSTGKSKPTHRLLSSGQMYPLSASMLDPCQIYVHSPLPLELVSVSNKYCISVLWPNLMPEIPTDGMHWGVQHWFHNSTLHPALHSAMLFGAYSHRRTRWLLKGTDHFGVSETNQMRQCEADSIAKISAALQEPSQAVSDEIILSVLCLAANKQESQRGKQIHSPFQAPLRSLQWLDVYGILSANPVHVAGLFKIIHLKGGLEKIELPGVAATIAFFGILNASKTLTAPTFPFISLRGAKLTLHQVISNDMPTEEAEPCPLLEICLTDEMDVVIRGIRKYISLVLAYQDGVQVEVNGCYLCDFRNVVQWQLMLLPPAHELIIPVGVCPLYEACRLALTIFGVGIVFPLPAESAPLASLAEMLRVELESYKPKAMIQTPHTIAVRCWCLVMGGVAATGTPHRRWFVQQLGQLAGLYGFSTWERLRRLMMSIIWLQSGCDPAGKQLWDEVMDALGISETHTWVD